MGPINVQPLRIGLDKMVDRQLMDTLVQMKDRHRDRLMAIPGVNGLGVGFVFKDGERTDELGIVVYVDEKLAQDQIDQTT